MPAISGGAGMKMSMGQTTGTAIATAAAASGGGGGAGQFGPGTTAAAGIEEAMDAGGFGASAGVAFDGLVGVLHGAQLFGEVATDRTAVLVNRHRLAPFALTPNQAQVGRL